MAALCLRKKIRRDDSPALLACILQGQVNASIYTINLEEV